MPNNRIQAVLQETLGHLSEHGINHAKETLIQKVKSSNFNSGELNNLGLSFYQQIEYELSKHLFEYILTKEPSNYVVHNNLGLTLNRLALSSQAVDHYRKALEIRPQYHNARSNLAYTLLYFGEPGRGEILDAHKNIAKYAFPNSKSYIDNERTNNKKVIKIGYVSSDLRNHAVSRFMQGILEKHDRKRFDVHVFDNRTNNSDSTAQHLKSLKLNWHDISELSTEEAIKSIIENSIDILIDLSGHTNGGRPDIFSHKVAPIQITYLGYPSTSGIPNMDYRIGDDYSDLTKFSNQNTEEMLRLPVAMWNYQPWPSMPKHPTDNPFIKNGYITFGSANNHAKLQEPWLKVWAKVLLSIPDSKLHFKSRALKSQDIRDYVLSIFTHAGVSKDRIILKYYSPTKKQHWEDLSQFDIALDSYPYNGTTTTCDLLNLGIPVVSRSGQSHVSRTTGSILNTLNLQSWISENEKDFVNTCQEKASNYSELVKLRQSLSKLVQSTTLGNSNLFMAAYEELLITTWENK